MTSLAVSRDHDNRLVIDEDWVVGERYLTANPKAVEIFLSEDGNYPCNYIMKNLSGDIVKMVQVSRLAADTPRRRRTYEIPRWSSDTAERAIFVRSRLALLVFSPLSRLTEAERAELAVLAKELSELETLKQNHTQMRSIS